MSYHQRVVLGGFVCGRLGRGSYRTPFTALVSTVVVVLVAFFSAGCGETPFADREEDTTEKAKRVAVLRREADSCLERFLRSENDPEGVDLEALECFTERHKESTEIFPSPVQCPLCFLNYGRGLKMLGFYYWTISEKLRDQLDAMSPDPSSTRSSLERRVAENDALVDRNLRLALQQFEAYLRSGGTVDYRTYQWCMEICYLLEDYRRALHYVNLFARNAPLTEEDKVKVARWEKKFRTLYERQQLQKFSDDFEG